MLAGEGFRGDDSTSSFEGQGLGLTLSGDPQGYVQNSKRGRWN